MPEENVPKFHRDKEGKIQLIIETFLKLINTMDYSEVSTNKIAKEAGISIGTIYNYFRNKEEILQYIFGNITMDFIEFSEIVKIVTKKDLEAIKMFIWKYLKSHQEYYVLNKAHDQAMVTSQNIFQEYQGNIKQYTEVMVKQFNEHGIDYGSADVETFIHVFLLSMNIVDSQVHLHLFREPIFKSDEELVAYLAKLFKFNLELYL